VNEVKTAMSEASLTSEVTEDKMLARIEIGNGLIHCPRCNGERLAQGAARLFAQPKDYRMGDHGVTIVEYDGISPDVFHTRVENQIGYGFNFQFFCIDCGTDLGLILESHGQKIELRWRRIASF
jgi:hypothetical protein